MWCIRVGQPFGWLILSGAKPLETRKDYKNGPKHLPGLKSGELVLVLLDDQWFPPHLLSYKPCNKPMSCSDSL